MCGGCEIRSKMLLREREREREDWIHWSTRKGKVWERLWAKAERDANWKGVFDICAIPLARGRLTGREKRSIFTLRSKQYLPQGANTNSHKSGANPWVVCCALAPVQVSEYRTSQWLEFRPICSMNNQHVAADKLTHQHTHTHTHRTTVNILSGTSSISPWKLPRTLGGCSPVMDNDRRSMAVPIDTANTTLVNTYLCVCCFDMFSDTFEHTTNN